MRISCWRWFVQINWRWMFAVCLTMSAPHSQAFEAPKSIEGVTTVTSFQLLELLQSNPNIVLIDVRAPVSYQRFKSIPGSINIPFGQGYETSTQVELIQSRWPNRATPLAVYCNGVSCRRSSTAARALTKAGYTQIYWFREGAKSWRSLRLPLQ